MAFYPTALSLEWHRRVTQERLAFNNYRLAIPKSYIYNVLVLAMDKNLRSAWFMFADQLRGNFAIVDIIEQFAILIFLKMLDDAVIGTNVVESPPRNTFVHRKHEATPLFPLQAERYRWRNWSRKVNGELRAYINDEVIPYMASLVRENATVAAFFKEAQLSIDDSALNEAVEIVTQIDFAEMPSPEVESLLEGVIDFLEPVAWSGSQYRTSPAIRRVLIALVDPQAGEAIHDPACGTGGLLVDAIDRIKQICESSECGDSHSTGLAIVSGIDISRQMARIATVNLALHGAFTSSIIRADALEQEPLAGQDQRSLYDIVLVDPPFNGRYVSRAKTSKPQSPSDGNISILYLRYAMRSLRAGGRCAIVVPPNILFNASSSFYSVRAELLNEFQVEAVIGLPPRALSRYVNVPSAIIYFRKPIARGSCKNESILFHSVESIAETRTLDGRKISPIDDLISALRSRLKYGQSEASANDNIIEVPLSVVIESGCVLSISRYQAREYAHSNIASLTTLVDDWNNAVADIVDRNQKALVSIDTWISRSNSLVSKAVRVGEISNVIQGRSYDLNSSNHDQGLPIVRIGNVTGTKLNAEWYFGDDRGPIVKNDDILVTNAGTIGVYRWTGSEGLLGQNLLLARLLDDSIDESYFFYALRFLIDELRSRASGQTIQRIAREQILTSRIPVPSLSDQREVTATLDSLDAQQTALASGSKHSAELGQSVLANIFGNLL